MKITSVSPLDNKTVVGEVEISAKEEIVSKIIISKEAFKLWGEMPLKERINYLKEVVNLFKENSEKLAKLEHNEMGMLLEEAKEDLASGIEYFEWYLENAEKVLEPNITYEDENEIHKVFYEPRGVVASIVPWNFPFSNVIWQTGQNLIVGNTVILKHSEETIVFGKFLEEIINKSNLPKGVFQEVYGDGEVGKILVDQDIDMICFTGSTRTGEFLYKKAAEKMIPILMELGGSAPGIALDDINIDEVIDSIYINRFLNAGQVCDGQKRLIVHEKIYDELIDKLKEYVSNIEMIKDMQPIVSKKQLNILKDQVKDAIDKGAEVLVGGKELENNNGNYYYPTILTNIKKDMRVWKEEVFGPVLPIIKFTTVEEAIELANDTQYGLGGYVYTNNKEAYKKISNNLKTGMVGINNSIYIKPCNPFGGYKKSGLGRSHGQYGFYELTEVKVVVFEKEKIVEKNK